MGVHVAGPGERELQRRFGTIRRAEAFVRHQVVDRLNPKMRAFIGRQEMAWVATADAEGRCDCSFRAGPPGFVRVLDEKTLLYPEFQGNGVMASLGNLVENPGMSILFVDFLESAVGLHVNGAARLLTPEEQAKHPTLLPDAARAPRGESRMPKAGVWVRLEVEEAYIHCSKHIPRLERPAKPILWGKQDSACRTVAFFQE